MKNAPKNRGKFSTLCSYHRYIDTIGEKILCQISICKFANQFKSNNWLNRINNLIKNIIWTSNLQFRIKLQLEQYFCTLITSGQHWNCVQFLGLQFLSLFTVFARENILSSLYTFRHSIWQLGANLSILWMCFFYVQTFCKKKKQNAKREVKFESKIDSRYKINFFSPFSRWSINRYLGFTHFRPYAITVNLLYRNVQIEPRMTLIFLSLRTQSNEPRQSFFSCYFIVMNYN